MPGPTVTFPMQLPPQVRRELEAFIAQLNEGYLYVEHNEDGTHGDITANSITLAHPTTGDNSGELVLYDEHGRAVTLDATDSERLFDGSTFRIQLEKQWGGIFPGGTALRFGLMHPYSGGEGDGPGVFIREESSAETSDGWAITASPFDLLLTGRTMLAFTDTRDNHIVFMVRPVGAPGAVTQYVVGPQSGVHIGTTVTLGHNSNGNRWDEVNSITANLFDSLVIGPPASSAGVKLRVDGAGVLGIVNGDASAYAGVNTDYVLVTTLYVGGSTADDIRFHKVASGVAALELGDGSGFAGLNLLYVAGTNVYMGFGTAAEPPYTFFFDRDTGFFQVAENTVGVTLGGTLGVAFTPSSASGGFGTAVANGAFGAGNVTGSYLQAGRNTSGNGAAATLRLERKSGGFFYVWPDDTGVLRLHNAAPEEDGSPSDTAGVAVGDQTSSREFKEGINERVDYTNALMTVLSTPVFDFTYKDKRYHGETFTGIIAEESPIFAKDNGKAFNEVTAFGYLVNAIKALQTEIEVLHSEIDALKGKRVE